MARGIAHGVGLGGYLAHHVPLLDAYPPGYPLVLAPLLWLFGSSTYVPERILSTVCMAGLFPLVWVWLGRRRVPETVRAAVLTLLALSPLVATYGSMVMAEAPFLLVLGVLLVIGDRWEAAARSWCPAAIGTVALVVAAVWLKEAGLAFVPGLVLWLAWRRRWWPALVAGATGVALLMPIVVGRLATGVPVAGARYTSELGGYYAGGLLHRIALVPMGVGEWFFDALPSAIVPTGSPLSANTALFVLFRGLACTTTALFVVIGTVTWLRRRGADLAFFLVVSYVGEVCLYKYVNDRRAVLVLPILLTWYVVGVVQSYRWLTARARDLAVVARWRRGFAFCGLLAVAGPLSAQFPTDYRYDLGQNSSTPANSPYMALLLQLGHSSQVVETTYLWSTALFSRHATDNLAAIDTASNCDPASVVDDLRSDNASYLLTAAIDIPGEVDSPCLEKVAASSSWAVPLLQTPVDSATVYELVGPQTAQPNMRTLLSIGSTTLAPPRTAGTSRPTTRHTPDIWRWSLPAEDAVRQISVGGIAAATGATGAVSLRLLEGTRWHTLASVSGTVGATAHPFLLATLPAGTEASAIELSVVAPGPVHLDDLAVLGTSSPPPTSPRSSHSKSRPVAPAPTAGHHTTHSPLVALRAAAGPRPLG
jgi:hypothetical protein